MVPIWREQLNGFLPSSNLAREYFLHIAPEFLKDWLAKPENVDKPLSLRERERCEAERFNRPPVHLGAAYWALHSLSHTFMAELALECGYPLSSLKERIYSSSLSDLALGGGMG